MLLIVLSQLHFPINTNENIAEIDRLPTILFSSVRSVFFQGGQTVKTWSLGRSINYGCLYGKSCEPAVYVGVSLNGGIPKTPQNYHY